MPTYAFRCKACGTEFDRTTHADKVKCEQLVQPINDRLEPVGDEAQCTGWARRVWSVNVNIQNLRAEREGR
jgi:predicted nucleic acid-binding Zn ribbon protein